MPCQVGGRNMSYPKLPTIRQSCPASHSLGGVRGIKPFRSCIPLRPSIVRSTHILSTHTCWRRTFHPFHILTACRGPEIATASQWFISQQSQTMDMSKASPIWILMTLTRIQQCPSTAHTLQQNVSPPMQCQRSRCPRRLHIAW